MAEPLVPDELWEAIAPLLPRHKARPGKRGPPPVDDRACLTGIVFVLRSGIPWEMLPQEMGCGSGVTCWRRLRRTRLADHVLDGESMLHGSLATPEVFPCLNSVRLRPQPLRLPALASPPGTPGSSACNASPTPA
jgi:Putative transposase of IS4/5 family (DUF4096)